VAVAVTLDVARVGLVGLRVVDRCWVLIRCRGVSAIAWFVVGLVAMLYTFCLCHL
jgi:hypothetical protein